MLTIYDPPGIAQEDLAQASTDSVAVVRDARAAGVWVFGCGLMGGDHASVVARDGTVTDGPFPGVTRRVGGFSVLECATREDALAWARKIAAGCHCDQELVELHPEPAA